jgi:hypothetical protein
MPGLLYIINYNYLNSYLLNNEIYTLSFQLLADYK